ncbi:hypothetical protein K491DRAFT_753880 [Lophiostoma macrostomum CBS 122681]|uniref:C2H2-type domain-containing protein n=1 Tax=Lophiostoma macrostomum CBS 122681 TaxID=1314788 RepID=A0A6A6TRP4_9PLEO|nr:hypothetical protein K491DRAFT_753880 [Lophiostoma macrostomum CBS 122681]
MRSTASPPPPPTVPPQQVSGTGYPCFFPDCTHTAPTQVALHDHHQRTHTNLPLHRCPVSSCPSFLSNEIFTHTAHFEAHMSSCHASYQFTCDMCAADAARLGRPKNSLVFGRRGEYGTYGALKRHQELAHGVRASWTCGHCGEVVGRQKEYVLHLKRHREVDARVKRRAEMKARREEERGGIKGEVVVKEEVVDDGEWMDVIVKVEGD